MSHYVDFDKKGREIEWLELNLLLSGRPMSKSQVSKLINAEEEDSIEESDIKEYDVDSMFLELERRITYYKQKLYKIERNIITPLKNYKEIPEYFLCVFFAYFGASNNSEGTKLFELISGKALKNFLNGEVKILGFPENTNLNTFLDETAKICYEERGKRANTDYKDDGVDVIGYKLFDDERGGNLYVLLQCAAGVNWTTKKRISLNRWTNYILWYGECILSSISTTEFVKKKDWDKRTSDYGMLIDRLRIYNTLYSSEIDNEIRKNTLAWCEQYIDEVC